MKRYKLRLLALTMALILILPLAACGSASGDSNTAATEGAIAQDMAAFGENGGWAAEAMSEPVEAPAAAPDPGGETYDETKSYTDDLKIIRTGNLSLETEDFDGADALIRQTVAKYGGILAESSISGVVGERWANYTARVPSESFDDFFYAVSGSCTVINQSITAEDVTERYTDLSTQLETNKKKYARLLELMESAKTLTDLYSIQSEIADVEYEIDSITGMLNGMDSRISYSTIYIGVNETNRASAVPEDPGFLASFSAALKNGTGRTVDFFQNLLISIAYHWFGWLVFLIVVAVALTITLRMLRKKKKAAEPVSAPPPENFSSSENK